ncbi:type II toxin-antitoxin system ParD family antitoxin [Galbibacter sp. EGI 63066]|uniref:type II toxin-antitoxin system ParD family antitoxin n=1 Tax=Galbibacter sp. EGI 63066 TaxID=2993559 RepID=UPI002249A0A8|nr:type II toxin-antitoxin system ParD family antitoxin [Galbibacter sp. EGI 63066]MCX2679092.1 type II toxin-antitoxin system ParD family antitoxin [Galbibacter sp. EGI 63066]
MATVRKSITFTEQQDNWIKRQIDEGYFTNDSEYIRDLVRRDQARNDKLARLRLAIDEGFESGVSDKSVSDIMKDVEENLRLDGRL